MILSIIIPTLKVDYDFYRCIYSVMAALDPDDYEIIVITTITNKIDIINSNKNISIFVEKNRGIYEAMNQGIEVAKGDYLLFLGKDDIVLDPLRDVVKLLKEKKPSIIISDVILSSGKIYKNYKNKYFLLIKNWCHQGIVYRKDIIKQKGGFKIEYIVQADHYLNILLATSKNINIIKNKYPITNYSTNGFSSYTNDFCFRDNFPKIVKENYGTLFYLFIIIKRFIKENIYKRR